MAIIKSGNTYLFAVPYWLMNLERVVCVPNVK